MRNPTKKRLRHRIPVRLRHHWRLVATTCAFVGLLTGVFGGGMVQPYVTSTEAASTVVVTQNITGEKDFFDGSTSHDIQIEFNDANYQKMLQEYFETGEKEYIPADIVIDGTTIKDVGIRLKGNSTLMALTWNGETRNTGTGGGGQPPGGAEGQQMPEGFPQQDGGGGQNGGGQDGAGQDGGFPGGGGQGGDMGRGMGMNMELKAEKPESLPWLIRFDEYVEGRRYQGHSQVAVRPGTTESSAQLNEATSISLIEQSGEPAQRSTYAGFSVNGRTSTPRLVVEYLDEGYAENLGNGVLYKALASGQDSYQGGDQTAYTDDFKQINKIGSQDLGPLIDFLEWLDKASDKEFAAELDEWIDVESFARYVAVQNLTLNFDDMAGPGKNYYLWYDLDTENFTIISWDMNLALNGDATAGPHDSIGGFGGGQAPGGQGDMQMPEGMELPEGMEMPEGMELPEGMEPPEGMQPPGGGQQEGGQQGAMAGVGGNELKERFLDSKVFESVYEEQYRQVYDDALADGQAVETLDDIVESYKRNDNATIEKVESEAAQLRKTLDQREKALASNDVIRGE